MQMEEDDIQKRWEEIRDYYRQKKEVWAKGKSYYQGHPEWGTQRLFGSEEPAGYELKAPYTVEEVECYEETLDVKLPTDLKTYLTDVSRELFVAYYPMVFSLHASGPLPNEFKLPEEKSYWWYDDCLVHGAYPQLPEPHNEDNDYGSCDCEDWTGGMVRVGEGGCTDTDLLVIKGTQVGTVWCVGSGGDSLHRRYDSFWDYIYSPIKTKKDREDRPSPLADLMSTAQALEFLRIMSWQPGLYYSN
jgi:hypothetical protein